jgi:hypothetical protein
VPSEKADLMRRARRGEFPDDVPRLGRLAAWYETAWRSHIAFFVLAVLWLGTYFSDRSDEWFAPVWGVVALLSAANAYRVRRTLRMIRTAITHARS